MKIRNLSLVGFKSFVDPTTLSFDSPITCIVGPNGCGKSNVVDAIRWVMGEMSAKSLRGKGMEDLIFVGSESRPSIGMAEVSLTFSTEDGLMPIEYARFSEITVTRRLFRSGESEYLINNISCRHRDIVDLFLGTGVGHRAYSVIEQGRIDFAINSKPEDRRLLIEEAAGVSKFKIRREAALRRMEGTKTNLTRLADILAEVRRQINSLDRQVKKAEKYKEIRDELRQVEVLLAGHKWQEMNRETDELGHLLADWQRRETDAGVKIASLETNLETGRLVAVEREREFSELQEKIYALTNEIQLMEAKQEFQVKEVAGLEKQIQNWIAEIDQSKERLLTLVTEKEGEEEEMVTILAEEKTAEGQLKMAEEEWKRFSEEQAALQKQIEEEKNALFLSLREMAMGESRKESFEARRIDLKARVARVEAEIAEIVRYCDVVQERVGEIQKLLALKKQEASQWSSQVDDIQKALGTEREARELAEMELVQKKEELVLRRSRLKSLADLERNFEGYQEGVRSVLRARKSGGKMTGILGVVADYVESPPQYEAAVSAALGEKLQSIIVKSHEEGVDAISYLKTEGQGRSTFIPLGIRETHQDPFPHHEEGVIGPLANLINVKGDFAKLSHYLFGDFVLVENLARALSLWKANGHKKTLVTLDGEVVDPYGVVSGGRGGDSGKMILEKKREMQELKGEVREIEAEVGAKEDLANQKAARVSSLEISLENARNQRHETEMAIAALEKDLSHEESEVSRYVERKTTLEVEFRQLGGELSQVDDELYRFSDQKGGLTSGKDQRELIIRELQNQLQAGALVLEQQSVKLTGLKVRMASTSEKKNHLQEGLGRIEETRRDVQTRVEGRLLEITGANQKQASLALEGDADRGTLVQKRESLTILKGSYEEQKKVFETAMGEQQALEISMRDLRKEYDLSRSHTGDLKVTLTQLKSEKDHLTQQILERYSVDLAQAERSAPEGFDPLIAETEVMELKARLEKMGDVNLGALPEYEELRTRHDFLSKQYEDLEKSLEALGRAITRINQATKKRFEETLELVNERFKVLFPKLFRGGRAELSLTDPSNLLESGVEIMVQPPGKKLQHISLLSGGEKALSATALVFSIFLVKPSPFCILDEVDAPLDEVNVGRFHELIREMTGRTQFILISHNKKTMEMADTLYGVTMEEAGVSKIVSVKLA
ncbi:MAG: chromosome segregation protein SMC [Deltaproteobacteria bacterium]|nr:chromosome segregation protein SMC [Deltaproteobacteria bacterium]